MDFQLNLQKRTIFFKKGGFWLDSRPQPQNPTLTCRQWIQIRRNPSRSPGPSAPHDSVQGGMTWIILFLFISFNFFTLASELINRFTLR